MTLWRDWLTPAVLAGMDLSERQREGLMVAKAAGRITNSVYRERTGASESTALRELRQLATLGLLIKAGGVGRGAHYAIARSKPVENPPKASRGR